MSLKFLCGGLAAAVLAGGAAYAAEPGLCFGASTARSVDASPEAGAPLTLETAVSAVRAASPELRAAALETLALRAEALQTGLPANPEMSLEVEDFDATGYRAFGASEATLSISQSLPLGGRLARARAAGEAWAEAAEADCQARALELMKAAAALFYDLAAAERRIGLAEDSVSLSQEIARSARQRVEGGAAPRIESVRAEAGLARVRADTQTARAEAETFRMALASLWGAEDVSFGPAHASDHAPLPTLSDVLSRLDDHPLVAQARSRTGARRADAALARAEAYPDIDVSLGVRRFRDTDDAAVVAGISLPLPVFNRNQGGRRAAGHRRSAAQIDAVAVRARLAGRIRSAYATAAAARMRASVMTEEALPSARAGFEAARTAYQEGKTDLTALLDARRSFIETRMARVDAEREAGLARAELLALGGYPPFAPIDTFGANR